jgi:sulfotransferase family protein
MPRMVPLPTPVKRVLRPVRYKFQYATRARRILPTFLVIGAQRAGTTSLFNYLLGHPDVAGPRGGDSSVWWVKETHFFDEKFSNGVDWYRSFFPLEATRERHRKRGHDLIAGEATPYYMFHPAVPARVAATLPEVRLIALLRNPVDRAYSHYHLMARTGRERLSFEEALAAEPERLAGVEELLASEKEQLLRSGARAHHQHRHRAYFSRGLYAEQLERWLEYFRREQLLVIKAENLLARPAEVYAQTLDFLGLRDWELEDFPQHNKKPYSSIDPELRARIEARYAEPNRQLEELLGEDLVWPSPTEAPR